MEEIKLREQLLVQKCLNTIINDYREREDVNALIDRKLEFLSFLNNNEPEEVLYGIEYIRLQYEDIYVLLGSMIFEYQQNKLQGSLYCKPIPNIESSNIPVPENVVIRSTVKAVPVTIRIKEANWLDKIKNWCKELIKNNSKEEGND